MKYLSLSERLVESTFASLALELGLDELLINTPIIYLFIISCELSGHHVHYLFSSAQASHFHTETLCDQLKVNWEVNLRCYVDARTILTAHTSKARVGRFALD